jgi:hypothetical protein
MKKKLFENINGNQFKLNKKALKEYDASERDSSDWEEPDSEPDDYDWKDAKSLIDFIFKNAEKRNEPVVYESDIFSEISDRLVDADIDRLNKIIEDIASDYFYKYDETIIDKNDKSIKGAFVRIPDEEL